MATHQDPACKELVELVTDYLEGVMPPDLRTAFEEHLEVCDGCRLYLGQMRVTVRALQNLPLDALSVESRQSLLHQFRVWAAQGA